MSDSFCPCLPRDHLLFPSILPLLEPEDWLNLRATSKANLELVADFLKQNRRLRLRERNSRNFLVLTAGAVRLSHLSFHSCSWLTDLLLRPILESNPRLEELRLEQCPALSSGCLLSLGLRCPSVTSLQLPQSPWLNSEALEFLSGQKEKKGKLMSVEAEEIAIDQLCPEDAIRIMGASGLRTKPELRKKSKFSCADTLYHSLQSGTRVLKIHRRSLGTNASALHHPQPAMPLTHLDVSACVLSDSAVSRIASSCPHLASLSLAGNWALSDASLAALGSHTKALCHLDIRGCDGLTDKGLFTVVKHCKELKVVNLEAGGFSRKVLNLLKSKNISLHCMDSSGLLPLPRYKVPNVPNISPHFLNQLKK